MSSAGGGPKLATAYYELIPSMQGSEQTISAELGNAGTAGGKSFNSRLLGIVGGLAAPLAAAAGIRKIISTGFDEAKDAAAGTAQLAAGIKSTGNAAGVSVGQLNALAGSIQGYSGQTDDSIVSAEQLLLTFTNIKNVGPDKIFDQATTAAANMAAKMGGDASSNAIILGKALNDPVAGISALTRVGVSFTDQQKAQIGQMVAANDTLGAQKIILGELNKEFGGSAVAFGNSYPGMIQRAKRAFEDFSQGLVQGMLPVLQPILGRLIDLLQDITPAASAAGQVIANGVGGAIKFLGPVMDTISAALGPVFEQLKPLIPQFLALYSSISPVQLIFKAIAPFLPQLVSAFGSLASTLLGSLGSAITTLLPVFQQLAGIIVGALGTALQALLPVVIQVVGILGPVLGTIVSALVPIITVLAQVFGQLIQAVAPLIAPILSLVAPLLQLAAAILKPLVELFSALITPILGLIPPLVTLLVPVLQVIITVLTAIVTGVVNVITWFVQLITGSKTAQKQLSDVWNGVLGFFSDLWHNVIGFFSNGIKNILDFFGGLPGQIMKALAGAGTWLVDIGKNMIQGLINGAGSLLKNIGSFFLQIIPSWIVAPFKAALGIHSPSTVFAGFGTNITAGLIQGVSAGRNDVNQALSDLVDVGAVSSSMVAAVAAPGLPQTASTSSAAPATDSTSAPLELSDKTISKLAAALAQLLRVWFRMGSDPRGN